MNSFTSYLIIMPLNCNVKNANYERVISAIERIVRDEGTTMCSCDRCISDIAAIALNYLPPHYYYVQSGTNDDAKSEAGSPWVMIEAAVRDAIEIVKEMHHHDLRDRQRSS